MLSGQDHSYGMSDHAFPGALQRAPIGIHSNVPSTQSQQQVCSPARARGRLLLSIHGEQSPRACSSSTLSHLLTQLRAGFAFPEGFPVPLLGLAFLP